MFSALSVLALQDINYRTNTMRVEWCPLSGGGVGVKQRTPPSSNLRNRHLRNVLRLRGVLCWKILIGLKPDSTDLSWLNFIVFFTHHTAYSFFLNMRAFVSYWRGNVLVYHFCIIYIFCNMASLFDVELSHDLTVLRTCSKTLPGLETYHILSLGQIFFTFLII